MKVLIGTDGSPCAGIAVELAAGLAWPAGSNVTLVSAVDAARLAGPFAGWAPVDLSELESDLGREMGAQLAADAAHFSQPDLRIDREVLLGRPSTMLADKARDVEADMIIVGNRGRGGIRSMLLGSVSAEVVDSAPCPVLVARGTHLRRILLANDGSQLARAAQEVLAAWPVLADIPVEVMSVTHGHDAWQESIDLVERRTVADDADGRRVGGRVRARRDRAPLSGAAGRLWTRSVVDRSLRRPRASRGRGGRGQGHRSDRDGHAWADRPRSVDAGQRGAQRADARTLLGAHRAATARCRPARTRLTGTHATDLR